MIIFIYNFLFFISLVIALPFLAIFMPKKELKMRLAINNAETTENLWFHCASIGELNAAKPFLSSIKEKFPHIRILMSTMTNTGYESAKTIKDIDEAILLPFDLVLLYRKFLRKYNPKALVIVETELWFSLLNACRLADIPVLTINGRISDKSFNKYKLISRFVKKDFQHVSFVGAQSEENKTRFLSLGFRNVHNTHNLKFCTKLPKIDKELIKKEWNIKDDAFIVVWGSSREGEEELMINLRRQLKMKVPNLIFILAPRHLNRLPQVEDMMKKKNYRLLSNNSKPDADLIVIDSIGKLIYAYAIADIAIIGGSFLEFGGHNPLEPLFYGVPTIIGNYHSSCRDLVDRLADGESIIISNRKRLFDDVLRLTKDKQLRRQYGLAGEKTIRKNACSVEMNMNHLNKVIDLGKPK